MAPGAPVQDTHGISLPARYEIRQVTIDLAEWMSAITYHGHYFDSPIWSAIHVGELGKQTLETHHALKLWHHAPAMAVGNGLSYFIWDKEFAFQRVESRAVGGALYWDEISIDDIAQMDDETAQKELQDAMDIPIAAFAMSYDMFLEGDPQLWEPMAKALPLYPLMGRFYEQHDIRPQGSWEPTGPGQVVKRIGTGTRRGYDGQGLMKALARFVMLEMKARGFRGISIGCAAPQVHHVWMHPPPPMNSITTATLDLHEFEVVSETGETTRPFGKAKTTKTWHVWTDLVGNKSKIE